MIAFAKERGKEEEKEEEKEGNKVHTRSLSPRFEQWRERRRLSKRGRGPLERAKGVEISGAGGQGVSDKIAVVSDTDLGREGEEEGRLGAQKAPKLVLDS